MLNILLFGLETCPSNCDCTSFFGRRLNALTNVVGHKSSNKGRKNGSGKWKWKNVGRMAVRLNYLTYLELYEAHCFFFFLGCDGRKMKDETTGETVGSNQTPEKWRKAI